MRFVIVPLLVLLGCADTVSDVTPAPGPQAKADGQDSADHDCQIVLRTLQQPSGLPTHYANGVNWVVYQARVDVAIGSEGTPSLLYTNGAQDWWQIEGQPVASVDPGFDRYEFVLDRRTVPTGDNTAWKQMHIQVVPFLAFEDGRRVFDHNRFPSDFDNYVITQDETRFGDDPAVCHQGAPPI